jgi:hypothetical protein
MPHSLDLEPLGPLYRPTRYPDVKDPSVVFDGEIWHLFATGCGLSSGLEVLHCTAPCIDGPWTEHEPVEIVDADIVANPAAPGVVAEGARLHMFLQHDFDVLGGHIEHLASDDGGRTFVHCDTAVTSLPGTGEAGVYDPDPADIGGQRYLTYAAMSVVGRPDLFLARSTSGSWGGPWERCGLILGHHGVEYHNQHDDEDYEWGLEAPQLVELADGRVLLTAVCFLAGHRRGNRQRVLLAVADEAKGPYELIGPVLEPAGGAGENGHGTSIVEGGRLRVVYQERAGEGRPWHIRHAVGTARPRPDQGDVAAR